MLKKLVVLASLSLVVSCAQNTFRGSSNINGSVAENSPLDISKTINEDDRYGDMNNPNKTTAKPGGTTAVTGTNPGTLGSDYTEENITIDVGCDDYNPVKEYTGSVNKRTIVKVNGKVCGSSNTVTKSSSMNVLFVIDYSASMEAHKEELTGTSAAGHDPLTSGSCGRLQGAQKIINSLQSKYTDNQVAISFVGFASNVEKIIQPESLSSFKSNSLNSNVFCGYVKQETKRSGTNFIDALEKAKSLLEKNYKPHNIVYFITDGEQSQGYSNSTAVNRANQLRSALTNSVINAIYLNSNLTDTRSQNAISVLEQITLSSSRVKAVSSAAELVDQIDSFSDSSITIDNSNYPTAATLSAKKTNGSQIYSATNLGIQSVEQTDSTTWTYSTQPFYLVGHTDYSVDNVVNVKLQSTDGSTFNSTITIRYTKSK